MRPSGGNHVLVVNSSLVNNVWINHGLSCNCNISTSTLSCSAVLKTIAWHNSVLSCICTLRDIRMNSHITLTLTCSHTLAIMWHAWFFAVPYWWHVMIELLNFSSSSFDSDHMCQILWFNSADLMYSQQLYNAWAVALLLAVDIAFH